MELERLLEQEQEAQAQLAAMSLSQKEHLIHAIAQVNNHHVFIGLYNYWHQYKNNSKLECFSTSVGKIFH